MNCHDIHMRDSLSKWVWEKRVKPALETGQNIVFRQNPHYDALYYMRGKKHMLGTEYTLNVAAEFNVKATSVLAELNQEQQPAYWHAMLNMAQIYAGFQQPKGDIFFNLETKFLDDWTYVELLSDPMFLFKDAHIKRRVREATEFRLVAEITERDAITNNGLAALHMLAQAGYRFALDDIGQGMMNPLTREGACNLQRIANENLPVTTLKLDKTLVKCLAEEPIHETHLAVQMLYELRDMGFNAPHLILEGFYPSDAWWDSVADLVIYWQEHLNGTSVALSGVDFHEIKMAESL